MVLKKLLMLLTVALVLTVCYPNDFYPFQTANVTDYDIPNRSTAERTKLGTYVIRQDEVVTQEFLDEIDRRTLALEKCLKDSDVWDYINYDWIGVFVPSDWYVSACTGEQLIPSTPPPQGCLSKGLELEEKCYYLPKPTVECPCVCNVRAVIQDKLWIVTTPNLRLYKAELARQVLAINNPWSDEKVVKCLNE